MRGYGSSTIHNEPLAYCQELVVMEMIGLLDHLDLGKAVWVRHDWGSPTVWNIAAHFQSAAPPRSRSMCPLECSARLRRLQARVETRGELSFTARTYLIEARQP